MGLFRRDPAKVAERKRRRAERRRRRAEIAEQKAEVFDRQAARGEDAEIEATNQQGEVVRQRVKLHKDGSAQRNKRIAMLEKQVEELLSRVEELEEDLEEAKDTADGMFGGFLSTRAGMSGVLRSGVQLLNTGDVPHNPIGLAVSDGLDAMADRAIAQDKQGQVEAMRLGSLVAKVWAYWGPNGLKDVLGRDRDAASDAGK